jgi:hypothetical protein
MSKSWQKIGKKCQKVVKNQSKMCSKICQKFVNNLVALRPGGDFVAPGKKGRTKL